MAPSTPSSEGLDIVDLEVAVEKIGRISKDVTTIETYIRLASLPPDITDQAAKAKHIAQAIWECNNKYRFNYQSKYPRGQEHCPTARYSFNCAQNEARRPKSKKSTDPNVKQRDKGSMEYYPCDGWLHVAMDEENGYAKVSYKHEVEHEAYWSREVPQDIRDVIKNNPHLTVQQIWDEHVLRRYPVPKFSRKSVNVLWREQTSVQWKRDDDPFKSAKILLEEGKQGNKHGLYTVEPVPVPEEDGYNVLAFLLPDMLRKWGGRIRELQMDSAWETNGAHYEVYAILGEVYGSGCPLGYILVQSPTGGDQSTVAGAKEKFITAVLKRLETKWEIKPITTLTDKDWAEINSCRAVFPESKHQLCFWHCLRAIKTRLAILRRKPAPYNVTEAHKEFEFVKTDFVPDAESTNPHSLYKKYPVSEIMVPHLLVRFDVPAPQVPGKDDTPCEDLDQEVSPAPSEARRRIVLKVNGQVTSVLHIPASTPSSFEESEEGEDDDEDFEDFDDQVESLLKDADKDQEDAPDWEVEEGEKRAQSPTYVFCPAPHRKQLLRMFMRHYCQHPLFYERLETSKRTADDIRRAAVSEMYTFCEQRGLREVWGYFWTNWYSSSRWKLWARSASPYLSRQRTTMGTENFWRQLKHNFLHNNPRPPIDQLVWILINKVTPAYYSRFCSMGSRYAKGRSKALTSFQNAFKKTWKTLEKRPINRSTYRTDVASWDCNCGQQKYNAYHLCKHLVHAVGSPPPSFWGTVIRRRTWPLYQSEHLVALDPQITTFPSTLSGSITDGDDETSSESEDPPLAPPLAPGRKRARKSHPMRNTEDEAEDDREGNTSKRARTFGAGGDGIAGHESSHCESEGYHSDTISGVLTSDGEDLETELDELEEKLIDRAEAFEEAARIIREQVKHRNRIWMKGVEDSDLGRDVIRWKDNLNAHEGMRSQVTTWGRGKSKGEKMRAKHVMGYQRSSHEEGAH